MRFYSFVANLYLSPLQHGLQTAHAVSEMSLKNNHMYKEWAQDHKTIIICSAINSAGVVEAYQKAKYFGDALGMPATIFHEDIVSLNGAPTAAGIVVPAMYYDAVPYVMPDSFIDRANAKVDKIFGSVGPAPAYEYEGTVYNHNTPEGEFIKFLKSYRLA